MGWSPFYTLIGSASSMSSGFHPQSNGQSERANQDLETTLRCLVSANPTTWSQQLVWVEYTRNTLPCSATGLSPFECSLGYQPPLFPEQEVSIPSAQMFRCLSAAAAVPGREHGQLFSRPPPGIDDRRTATGPLLSVIILGRGYGCPLGICPSWWSAAKSPPDLSHH